MGRIPSAVLTSLLLVASVLVAGCRNDPDPLGSGSDSVYDALGELPASANSGDGPIFVGDLTRAADVAGLERPDGTNSDAGEWVVDLSGGSINEDPARAFVPLPRTLTYAGPEEQRERVGWSVVDVETFASTSRFLVASGDFDGDTLDDDLAEVEHGIVADGETDEEQSDVPTTFAEDDGRIAAATSDPGLVRAWLDDEESVADDDSYADVAHALDDHEVYSAAVYPMSGEVSYDVVGIGWSDDDGPVVTTAFHFGSEADAEDEVDGIEERFELDPIGDELEVEEAGTQGSSVVVTARPAEGSIDVVMQAMARLGPPFDAP